MIKKIAHLADIHIRTYRMHSEYQEQFNLLYESLENKFKGFEYQERRIVIAGDLFHQKITISNELIVLTSNFLQKLSKIAPLIIIAGNHDLLENNIDRLDSITPIVQSLSDYNITYYKGESKCYEDDNIVWCVYSIFDENKRPEIEEAKINYGKDKKYIGLYHAPIMGAKTDLGYEFDYGTSLDEFEGLDICMCGDIHLRQGWNHKGTLVQFSGSLVQQNYGEKINGHGYLMWDIENNTFEEIDIENKNAFYQFEINSINDIEENKEILKNI
jgi:DNA repair exonuclease SbcCD nuclease subunit